MADDIDRHIHIAHHLANDGKLLKVFFAEYRTIGRHMREQLVYNGGDTGEKMWPCFTLHRQGHTGGHDHGGVVVAIHIGRRINCIGAAGGTDCGAICLEPARIAVKIFAWRKLCRIDIDADHGTCCDFAGFFDQGQMAGMNDTLEDKIRAFESLLASLESHGWARFEARNIKQVAHTMAVVINYWMSFAYVRQPRQALEPDSQQAAVLEGVQHALGVLLPYLQPTAQSHLTAIMAPYQVTGAE